VPVPGEEFELPLTSTTGGGGGGGFAAGGGAGGGAASVGIRDSVPGARVAFTALVRRLCGSALPSPPMHCAPDVSLAAVAFESRHGSAPDRSAALDFARAVGNSVQQTRALRRVAGATPAELHAAGAVVTGALGGYVPATDDAAVVASLRRVGLGTSLLPSNRLVGTHDGGGGGGGDGGGGGGGGLDGEGKGTVNGKSNWWTRYGATCHPRRFTAGRVDAIGPSRETLLRMRLLPLAAALLRAGAGAPQ
jgi:hypothetical protein